MGRAEPRAGCVACQGGAAAYQGDGRSTHSPAVPRPCCADAARSALGVLVRSAHLLPTALAERLVFFMGQCAMTGGCQLADGLPIGRDKAWQAGRARLSHPRWMAAIWALCCLHAATPRFVYGEGDCTPAGHPSLVATEALRLAAATASPGPADRRRMRVGPCRPPCRERTQPGGRGGGLKGARQPVRPSSQVSVAVVHAAPCQAGPWLGLSSE